MYVNDKVKVSWLSWPTWMNRREWPSHSTLPNGCCVLIIDARQCERYFHFIIMNSWILTTHTHMHARTHTHTHTHTDGTVPLSCCLVLSCTAQGLMCGLSAASLQNFCWGWDLWSFVRRHIATHLVSCLQFTLTILCGMAAVHHTDPFHLPPTMPDWMFACDYSSTALQSHTFLPSHPYLIKSQVCLISSILLTVFVVCYLTSVSTKQAG